MSKLQTSHFVTARATLARRMAGRRAERFGRPIGGNDYDSVVLCTEVDDPPAPPIVFHLVYQDVKNELTGRCFTLRSLRDEIGEIRAGGVCHLRNAYRCFLASRIVEITDLATGEIHEDGLDYFRSHPSLQQLNAGTISAISDVRLAMNNCRDEVIILSFLAASDSDFDEEEEDHIVTHVMNRADDLGLSEQGVRRAVRSFIPDEFAFDRALGRMCAGEGDPQALMWTMRKVVDADGEVDPEEVAFVDEIESRLRAFGRL